MLELFKKNTFFGVLLLIPYAILLHTASWFNKIPATYSENCWFYNKIFLSFELSYPFETFLAIVLIFIQAFLISRMVIKFKLNTEGQLFSSLFFIIFCGFHHSTLSMNASLIANLFLILAMFEIIGIYNRKNVSIQLFNFGFLIGIATLFYPPYYVFIFLGFMAIIILRGARIKEFLQILGGITNVYLLIFAVFYILNVGNEFWNQQILGFFRPFIVSMKFPEFGWVAFGLIALFSLFNVTNYQFFQTRRSIIIQKQYDLIFLTLIISVFSLFFMNIHEVHHIIIFFTPLALLSGLLLTKIRNPLFQETLHLFLIITSLFLQFQNW